MFRFLPKFSLKILLLLISVLCIWIGWYTVRANSQRKCVAEVMAMGGGVVYSHRFTNGNYNSNAEWPGPWFIREWLGKDYVDHVVLVNFNGDSVQHLPQLNRLPKLKSLYLYQSDILDLSPVGNLNHLENLWIGESRVNSLEPIANCRSLRWINIAGSKVSDLTPLFDLPYLESVVIATNQISAEQLSDFKSRQPNCNIVEHD